MNGYFAPMRHETHERCLVWKLRSGYPHNLAFDNGRQFANNEFEKYCENQKIELNKSTSYFSQENDEVER